jgi:hypothetical protein
LAAKSFSSIQEKREYARTTLIERGDWNPVMEDSAALPDMSEVVHEDSEEPAVLQPSLPEKRMGRRSKKHADVPDLPAGIRQKKAQSNLLQSKVPMAGMAKPKGRKPLAIKRPRVCRACLRKFMARYNDQFYCDGICKRNVGQGHARLQIRLEELLRLGQQRMAEDLKSIVRTETRKIVADELTRLRNNLTELIAAEIADQLPLVKPVPAGTK